VGAAGGLLGDLLEAAFQNECGVDNGGSLPVATHHSLRVQRAPGMNEGVGWVDVCRAVLCHAMPNGGGGGEGAGDGTTFGNDHLHWHLLDGPWPTRTSPYTESVPF
jgi:hypothetical protein